MIHGTSAHRKYKHPALLCLICAAVPIACQQTLEAPIELEGVPACAKVSEGLYRGDQPTAAGFAELKKMGIKTVISLRDINSDYYDLSGTGLQYLHLHFNPAHPEEEDVVAFLKAATDPKNQPVFVHCHMGRDRTGMMVAVYRMVIEDWSRDEAIAEMKAMGFKSMWWQIEDYARHVDIHRIKAQLASANSPPIEVVP